jgi:phosphoribosylaminoimidazolecarboxamide formyltransferase/IMP cyclohydrolase
MSRKKIQSALISVFHKDNLQPIIEVLHQHNVQLFSTGGTHKFIEENGAPCTKVEDITGYPSILGGRVKTLHPKVFGGILSRRDQDSDLDQMLEYQIPAIDLVVVDLYPFEATVAAGANDHEIIEKIDIGGISLIRAAAKNSRDVLVVSSMEQYEEVLQLLREQQCESTHQQRQLYAARAFDISSNYDSAIFSYLNTGRESLVLRTVREMEGFCAMGKTHTNRQHSMEILTICLSKFMEKPCHSTILWI